MDDKPVYTPEEVTRMMSAHLLLVGAFARLEDSVEEARTFLTERGKLDQFNRSWGHTLHNRFDEAVDDLRTAYEAEVPAGIREQLRAKDLLPPFYK